VSGYLQRLIASATTADSRVRPVLAPMFSASAHDDQDLNLATDEMTSTPPPASLRQSAPLAAAEYSGVAKGLAVGAPAIPAREPSRPEPISMEPIQRAGEAPTQTQERWRAARPDNAREGSTARTDSQYTPLLKEPPEQLISRQDSSANPTVRARRADAPRSRTPQQTKSEPDEIQITIGRIEVSAVPEATRARPVAKAAYKPSLDDYLRRSDARKR
jgi:hypothetical protein